jgi:predicted solute-binding protein
MRRKAMYQLIVPLGIATYTFLVLTILIGKRIIKIPFKFHKISAVITLILGTIHAGLVIYNYYL